MRSPLVTIVTPSYNQGSFIRGTIESVLSQDYPQIEYIIMDGGSTDETASVAKDYASRLTFISEKDRGQSHAINKGFRLANGSILGWLNSDDVYLPGAVRAAVDGFHRNPAAGAVYGEGYLLDREGRVSSRFPFTEPFNRWKLVHLSDYILQQTVYFRKDVLDTVGYVDEDLHYIMDWEILIRIAAQYDLEYIPQYMGCLREYAEAKTFAGGPRRIRELHAMLRRHTGMRLPPGSIVYGLDTYHRIWCSRVERLFGSNLKPVSEKLQALIRLMAGFIISRTVCDAQGYYSDGWAGRLLRYMLPPSSGSVLIEGVLPEWDALRGQKLSVSANGQPLGDFTPDFGEFQLTLQVPRQLEGQLLNLRVAASRSLMPGRLTLHGDRRHLAYQLKAIRWTEMESESPEEAEPIVQPAAAGR